MDAGKSRAVHGIGSASGGFRRRVGRFSFVGGIARPEAERGAAPGGTPPGSGFTGDPDPLGSAVHESGAFVEFEASLPWLLPREDAD